MNQYLSILNNTVIVILTCVILFFVFILATGRWQYVPDWLGYTVQKYKRRAIRRARNERRRAKALRDLELGIVYNKKKHQQQQPAPGRDAHGNWWVYESTRGGTGTKI
jgi:hypothetical protein